ncbi:MAG: polysaccharide lyase [Holosporales bacterium]
MIRVLIIIALCAVTFSPAMATLKIERDGQGRVGRVTAFYPKGSINPSNPSAPGGGGEFLDSLGLHEAGVEHATLSYDILVPKEFAFGKGGKLPGLYGLNENLKKPPSGCDHSQIVNGFSARLMWRENGAASIYVYAPDAPNQHELTQKVNASKACGTYLGRGSFTLTPDRRTRIKQEILLNTPGRADGVLRLWVDGVLTFEDTAVVWRINSNVRLKGLFFSTFFGGKTPEWASPRDQSLTFEDFVLIW